MKADEKVNSNNLSYNLKIGELFIFLLKRQCPSYLEMVEQCFKGHEEVFKRFLGPTFSFGETVLITFRGHIDRLVYCSKSNSTIWSKGCAAIIKALSFLRKLGKNPIYFLNENGKATPKLFFTYRQIVTNLSNIIGELDKPINNELKTLENLFGEILNQFHASLADRKHRHCEKINFKGIMKCGRRLTNMIAIIAKTALLNYCGCVKIKKDTYEAIAVLISILYDSIMAILAVTDTMAAEIYSQTQRISDDLESYLHALDPFINGIHKTISLTPTDTLNDSRSILTTLVDESALFNQALGQLLGPPERVPITAVQVTKNLTKSFNAHHQL